MDPQSSAVESVVAYGPGPAERGLVDTTPWGSTTTAAHAALQVAAMHMERAGGGTLGPDQEALLDYIDDLAKGAPRARPTAATPLGHTFTPLQRLSVGAWLEGNVGFAPTAAAAKTDARDALRAMKEASEDVARAMHDGNRAEMAHVKSVLRARPPSTRDPAAMARHGGLPGIEPGEPRALPYAAAPAGHVRLVNAGALAAAHGEFCGECQQGAPCWIWPFAEKLHKGIPPEWAQGPSAVQHGPDRVPPASEPLTRLCHKWMDKGVMGWTERSAIVNPTMAFVAVSWQTPVQPWAQDAIAAGGVAGHEALLHTASQTAQHTWEAYVGKLTEGGALLEGAPSAGQAAAAWQAAVRAVAPDAKERLVVASHDLNETCAQTRFSYEKLSDLLARLKQGWWLAKVDIRSFFYAVPVNAELRERLGFPVHEGGSVRYAQMHRMSMGHRNSPFIASLISGVVHQALRERLAKAGVKEEDYASLCFVDDFLLAGASRAIVGLALRILREVLNECGLDVAEDKSTQAEPDGGAGAQRMNFLGVAVDTTSMTVCVPPEGLVKTARALMVIRMAGTARIMGGRLNIPANALARAAGLVTRLVETNSALGPLSKALVSAMGSPGGSLKWGPEQQTDSVLRDVDALLGAIKRGGWDRVQLRLPREPGDPRVIYATSDFGTAARTDAVAVVLHGVATCTWELPHTQGMLVADGELLAVALLLQRYGPALRGFTVVHGSDALGVTCWLQKNRASHATSNDLLLFVTRLAAGCGVELRHVWLSRFGNHVADRLCAGWTPEQLRSEGAPCPSASVRLTAAGTPNKFLKAFAPGMQWADDAWAVAHARK